MLPRMENKAPAVGPNKNPNENAMPIAAYMMKQDNMECQKTIFIIINQYTQFLHTFSLWDDQVCKNQSCQHKLHLVRYL